MEPKNGGLEDDFPFQTGDFSGSMFIFQGVKPSKSGKSAFQTIQVQMLYVSF